MIPQLDPLMASIPGFVDQYKDMNISEADRKSSELQEEEVYQSRFLMSSLIHNLIFDESKNSKQKALYFGVDNVEIWEMDDYFRIKMSDEKLSQLKIFFEKKEKILRNSIDFLQSSNQKGDPSFLIPRFVWTQSGTQFCLIHSIIDSAHYTEIKGYFELGRFKSTLEDLMTDFIGMTTETKCGNCGQKKKSLFCNHIGIIDDEVVKTRKFKWPGTAKDFFEKDPDPEKDLKVSFPFNSFDHTLFEAVCEDIIDVKIKERKLVEAQRTAKLKRKRGPGSKKPSFLDPLNNDKAENLLRPRIKVKADEYNHQFRMILKHWTFRCLEICLEIAVDVLRKSAIYLHFVNQYSDALKHIFEHKFLHPQNLYLFNNCFHSIKVFTSRATMKEACLFNRNDILSVYMLFTTESTFRLRLEANGGHGDPIIMKNYDVVLVTDFYPIDEFSVSHTNVEYVLISISISKVFYDLMTKKNNGDIIEKYVDFHKNYSITNTECIGQTPHDTFLRHIIDHMGSVKKRRESFKLTPIPFFKDHKIEMKYCIQLKFLYWETLVKKSINTLQIKEVIRLLDKLKNPKVVIKKKKEGDDDEPPKKPPKPKGVTLYSEEAKDSWDIDFTYENYEGAWDLVGYKRRSRRIRGLDVYFETKDEQAKREQLILSRKERSKRIQEENKRRFQHYKSKFNLTWNDPYYTVYVSGKTGQLMRRRRTGFVSINCKKMTGTMRSCAHDAIINVGSQLGIEMDKEIIYKQSPPSMYQNAMMQDVMNLPYVRDRLSFILQPMKGQKGGPEVVIYYDCLRKGGKYIVLCRVEYENKKKEYHAFVFDADYVNKEKKVKGAIIDNQSHNKLTGIEESDVRNTHRMRRVCLKLYGGKTFFTHCWEVRLKVSMFYNYDFLLRCKLIS